MTNEGVRGKERRELRIGRYLLHVNTVNTGNKISDITFSIFRSGTIIILCASKLKTSSFSFTGTSFIFNAKEVSAEPTAIT